MKKYNIEKLVGKNAFEIIAYVDKIMRENGYQEEEIDKYHKSATSSDYTNLVAISNEMVEKMNSL